MHLRITVLGAVLTMLLSLGSLPAQLYAQASNACAGADEYVAAVHELGDELEQGLDNFGLSLDEIEAWTASDFANASRLMDEMKSGIEDLTPPPAAEQAHEDAIRLFGTFSQMFTSMQTTGLFGALPYTESIEQTTADLDTSALDFEQACNVAFLDHDDDGSPEIGLGSSATPVSGNATGTRENPIPIGTPADVGDDWEVTVLSVEPDATALVLAESEYNDPPQEGHQFFLIEVSVTYTGEDADTFYSSDLAAVGESSVGYSTYEDSCGRIPDELPSRELFPGGTMRGNVCWSIATEDASSLVMYYGSADSDERVFFALTEAP